MFNLRIITFCFLSFFICGTVLSQDNTSTDASEEDQQEKPVTIGDPGEPITMGGEQEELLSKLAPEEESEAELKVNVMASTAAIAQMSCSMGEEAESFKSVQEAALEYLKKENARVLSFRSGLDQLQQQAREKNAQRQSGENFDYQIEGIKLQMVSTQMMIQNYISEENGSITNRNKLIKAFEEAELMALEEFENFENETNTCRSWIESSKERAEEGCERVVQVEVCEGDDCEIIEESDPEEGSCEAVGAISNLAPKLSEYIEHYAAIMGSATHKERYEEIKESFEELVTLVPSGEWKGQVEQCNSKLQELNKKTEVVCELNIISEADELDDEELEERELAQVNSFEEQPDAFSSMTSSDSEKRYLEYATMKKQTELDPYFAQSLNRPVLFPVIIEDLVAQNQVEIQKVQAHYKEYEKILNLYNGFKKQNTPKEKLAGDSSDEGDGNESGSGQSNLVGRQGPEIADGASASNVAFSGGGDFGLPSSGSSFGSGAISNPSSSKQSDTTISGSRSQAGSLNLDSSVNLGNSSALSGPQIKRKNELSKRADNFVKSLGTSSPVAQKRKESIQNSRRVFGAALTRKSKALGGLAKLPDNRRGQVESSPGSSEGDLSQTQDLNSSRGTSFTPRIIRGSERSKTRADENKSSGEKTSRVIGYKKSKSKTDKKDADEEGKNEESQVSNDEKKLTRLEQSQREIARIYSDYKKTEHSFRSSRSGGEIGEREDNLFDIITRRYIVSGFKRLDGVQD